MSRDQKTQDLKDKLACQNSQICILQEKLVTYDKDISKKDDLKCRLHNLQQWIEDVDCKVKQSNNDVFNIISKQKQKIKEAEVQECMLRSENTRLHNANDCIAEKLNKLHRKEQALTAEIEKLELCKINIQNELCSAQTRVDEMKCNISSLKKTLKTKEEECENVKKLLAASEAECKRLCAACNAAKCALERSKADVTDVKCRLKKTEECLKRERAILAEKLEDKERDLRVAKAELDTAIRTVSELRANTNKLEAAIAELRETMAREKCEAEAAARDLRQKNCVESEKLCKAKDELTEARRNNGLVTAKIESLKGQVRTNECLVDDLRQKSESLNRAKDEKCERLERERCTLADDVRCKKKKIADLERQLCRMREACGGGCGSGATGGCGGVCPSTADCYPSEDAVNRQDMICCVPNEPSFIDVLKRLYSDLNNIKVKPCNPMYP
ncbi:myosin-10-like [Metopolophium dirhodum]|uniref:myosin-10-like n=1 Tax=Metopolophium dirhodum TaxID=44670 RepID=UPI00298F91D2|nr:myosin-10-like [Metopolophium dirhodum]